MVCDMRKFISYKTLIWCNKHFGSDHLVCQQVFTIQCNFGFLQNLVLLVVVFTLLRIGEGHPLSNPWIGVRLSKQTSKQSKTWKELQLEINTQLKFVNVCFLWGDVLLVQHLFDVIDNLGHTIGFSTMVNKINSLMFSHN